MSDYDRGKYHGKKKYQSSQDGSSGFTGSSYYGRKSPSGNAPSFKLEKGNFREPASKGEAAKIKQPTILIKAREPLDEPAPSPKRSQKDVDTSATPQSEAPSPVVKVMHKSAKLLEDSVLWTDNIQHFLQENSDFLVVGVVGKQGVGKSTIMNLIAHRNLTDDLKKTVFKNNVTIKEDEYGDNFRLSEKLQDANLNDGVQLKSEIFKVQDTEHIESNSCATHGIDFFVTANRTILLDCQPFMSVSVLDDLVQSESKRSNLVSEYIQLENTGEIQALQQVAFLMSVCHVLIVVQDWFFDSNVIRFIQTAEMLKPTHSNPEDELNDHFPHLLMVHNRAQMKDFTPRKFQIMQEIYNNLFEKTKLQKQSNLGLATSKLINYLDQSIEGEPFNLFLIPEYHSNSDTYNGHPPIEEFIWKLRANILGVAKTPLTHIQLSEKTWLTYCSKVWENVKKSSFFVEYTKLMP